MSGSCDRIATTIGEMIAASASSDDRGGIKAAFELCLDLIEARDFSSIGRFMDAIDVDALTVSIMLAPLSITVPVRSFVPGRIDYHDRVEARLRFVRPADVGPLLAGLR